MSSRYVGITYPMFFFRWEWQYRLWKRFMCRRHMHLFDECLSSPDDNGKLPHVLVCDACQLEVHIERIDETYVKGMVNPRL